MLQTLFFIPAEIAGIPLFGVGLLLALWAAASVAILAWLAWRQGFNADTWGYVPVLLLVGAIVLWLLPALCENGELPIRSYGVMMFLAVVTGTTVAAWRGRRVGIDPDTIFSLAFWVILPGIVGARAFYVVEYWQAAYWPAYTAPGGGLGRLIGEVFSVNKGGLVVYGGFVGGVVGVLAFTRKHRLHLLALCDLIAPSMVLGLAIGRIGCLLNGCCYGAICAHSWAITFPPARPPYPASPAYLSQVARGQMYGFTLDADPKAEPLVRSVDPGSVADSAGLKPGDRIQRINGAPIAVTGDAFGALDQAVFQQERLQLDVARGVTVNVPAIPVPLRSRPVHPTQIYSTIDGLLLCLLLLAYAPFRRRDGEVFALMISIYPITRFLIESLRSDEAAIFGTGMSISQNVSILLLACAAALWVYIRWGPQGTHLVAEHAHHGDAQFTEKMPQKRPRQTDAK